MSDAIAIWRQRQAVHDICTLESQLPDPVCVPPRTSCELLLNTEATD
jgi:hypothetical protein